MATDLPSLLKENDACFLTSPDGQELVAVHEDTLLIPASILKIFTSLVGFHYLGPDYRFPTEIYMSPEGDLTLKGYGDPLMTSEILQELAVKIRNQLPRKNLVIRNIILDDTYFTSPLTVPGVSDSPEPYDAPNGALCTNFNTVSFRMKNGSYVSGEKQTPLIPEVLDRVRRSGLREGRIPLSQDRKQTTGYTGHLLKYFLEEAGVTITGDIRFSAVDNTRSTRLFTFYSPFTLSQAVSKLLEFSNNFMANQILIASGVSTFGVTGTLEKGVQAAERFAADQLALNDIRIVEGSGISRENRVTARMMLKTLYAFQPYHTLMQRDVHAFYKTGTLKGIATRAGYFVGTDESLYPFVVILNTSEGNMQPLMDRLYQIIITTERAKITKAN